MRTSGRVESCWRARVVAERERERERKKKTGGYAGGGRRGGRRGMEEGSGGGVGGGGGERKVGEPGVDIRTATDQPNIHPRLPASAS